MLWSVNAERDIDLGCIRIDAADMTELSEFLCD